jgi:hypothetical protein
MSTSIQNMWRITIIWYATDKLSKLLIKWPSATDSPRIGLTPLWKTSLILLSLWHFHFWKQSSRGENAIRRAIFPVPSCYGMPWLYWFGVKLFTVALLSLVDMHIFIYPRHYASVWLMSVHMSVCPTCGFCSISSP